MSSLNDILLAAVIGYGAPLLGLFLLLGAAGIPFPTSLLVIAAGGFVRQGFLDLHQAVLLGLFGAVMGDCLCFGIGRIGEKRLGKRFDTHPTWIRAARTFDRQAGIAIYLSRFLLSSMAIPVNLIAGAAGYPFWSFFIFVLTGEITWIALYGGLGYWFGSQWEVVSQFINDFSGLILGVAALVGALYLAWRWRRPGRAERS
jgi:membrane-associated protein